MEVNLKKLDLTLDEEHIYHLNGEIVPGVSTISGLLPKDFLEWWIPDQIINALKSLLVPFKSYTKEELEDILSYAKFAHRRSSSRAMDIGTAVHDWIEQYIKTKSQPPMPENDKAINCINAFLDWEKENKIEWILVEVLIASEKFKFGGKFDALAIVNGELSIIDWKTSKVVSDDYYLQTAGYKLALEEMGCPEIKKRVILKFNKENASFSVHLLDHDYLEDKNCFLGCLLVKRWLDKYKQKRKK